MVQLQQPLLSVVHSLEVVMRTTLKAVSLTQRRR